MLLLNAFSFNMVDTSSSGRVEFYPLEAEEATDLLVQAGLESAVGHVDTAAVFAAVLGLDVPAQRTTVSLAHDTWAIVGQYKGPRLEEGCKALPEGATIEWLLITIR